MSFRNSRGSSVSSSDSGVTTPKKCSLRSICQNATLNGEEAGKAIRSYVTEVLDNSYPALLEEAKECAGRYG